MDFEYSPIGIGVLILLTAGGFVLSRLRRRARSSNTVGTLSGQPKEIWNGHPVWMDLEENDEGEPIAGVAEIGVVSPATLQIRRRSRFRFFTGSLPRIDVPAVNETLDVRCDDAAFAHRLFADRAMVKTLPLALKGGGEVDISPGTVRVWNRAIDYVAKDALEAAKATAKAVVSTLNLPAPKL